MFGYGRVIGFCSVLLEVGVVLSRARWELGFLGVGGGGDRDF